MIPKEALQQVALITIIILLVGIGLYWKPKPRKRPAHQVEGEKRLLQCFDVIKETIPMCRTEGQLQAIELQVEDFYIEGFDFIQIDILKALVVTLDRAIAVQRYKITRNEKH